MKVLVHDVLISYYGLTNFLGKLKLKDFFIIVKDTQELPVGGDKSGESLQIGRMYVTCN